MGAVRRTVRREEVGLRLLLHSLGHRLALLLLLEPLRHIGVVWVVLGGVGWGAGGRWGAAEGGSCKSESVTVNF